MDGFEDDDGCPDPDNDNDGIPDKNDKCPNEPETINGYQDEDGCPDTGPPPKVKIDRKTADRDPRQDLLRHRQGDHRAGQRSACSIRWRRSSRGHTELEDPRSRATPTRRATAHNNQLSQERAESVRTYLIKKGVEPAAAVGGGYGPTCRSPTTRPRRGREANRRVEFHIVDEPKPEKKAPPADGDNGGGENAPEPKTNDGNKGE